MKRIYLSALTLFLVSGLMSMGSARAAEVSCGATYVFKTKSGERVVEKAKRDFELGEFKAKGTTWLVRSLDEELKLADKTRIVFSVVQTKAVKGSSNILALNARAERDNKGLSLLGVGKGGVSLKLNQKARNEIPQVEGSVRIDFDNTDLMAEFLEDQGHVPQRQLIEAFEKEFDSSSDFGKGRIKKITFHCSYTGSAQ